MKRTIRRRHKIKLKKQIYKKPIFWLGIFLFILICAGVYFFLNSNALQVSKIIISGNEKTQAKDIENLISEKIKQKFLFFTFQNIFLVSPSKITRAILEQYPNIGSAQIKRKFFDTLLVNVKERQPFAVFCGFEKATQDNCFFIDETGVAFEKLSGPASNYDFLIVRSAFAMATADRHFEDLLGREVINKDIAAKIDKIEKTLGDNFQIGVEEADIVSEERMNIKTGDGWDIYFNPALDMELQTTKLKLILEKEISSADRKTLQYIDLRFEDRGYYK